MFRRRLAAVFVFLVSISGPSALCAQSSSPINDLLKNAKDALNELKFARADSIARDVLALGSDLRRSQAILAWEIVAAAHFPEDAAARDSVAARNAFRSAIRLDLDATIPVDIRWPGLDALLTDEKRTAVGMAVRVPRTELIYGGSAGDAILRVVTTQLSDVWLLARAADAGTEFVVDSAVGTREAALRIRALRGRTAILSSGAYQMVVRSRDNKTGAILERSIQASVTAPSAFDLVPMPAPLDTSKLLPELKKTNRTTGISAGVIVGALTIALNQALRAAAPVSMTGTDSRATAVGLAIAAGTGVAVWFDRGMVLSRNREANSKLKSDAAQRTADTIAENERRTTGYRAKLTLLMEDK